MTDDKNEMAIELDVEINNEQCAAQKRLMKKSYSRVGVATLGVTAFMLVISSLFAVIVPKLEPQVVDVVRKYYLYINELMIALSVGVGLLLLIGLPSSKPPKNSIKPKHFFALLCMGLGLATVGNLISTTFVTFWNLFTQSQVTNPLVDLLMSIPLWQNFVCVVILAPLLEELFFRKLIIDKLYSHGEFLAIIVSSAFFALFHGNFSQVLYAFLLGVLLGYVYCKTGSFLTVTLMHMAFNFIGGQIPMFFLPKVLEFYSKLIEVDVEEIVNIILPLFAEYAVPILCYLAFLVVKLVIDIIGLVLLGINAKKISIEPADTLLSKKERAKSAFLNVGIIAATVLLLVNIIASLF